MVHDSDYFGDSEQTPMIRKGVNSETLRTQTKLIGDFGTFTSLDNVVPLPRKVNF